MEPYIPENSKLRGPNRPKIMHRDGNHKIRKKIKDGVLATKRALKKAVRREGKIDEREWTVERANEHIKKFGSSEADHFFGHS